MKLIAEYLDIAIKFECLASVKSPSKLKESFEKQAAAYRKLAAKRARKLGVLEPPGSISHVVRAVPVGEAEKALWRPPGRVGSTIFAAETRRYETILKAYV